MSDVKKKEIWIEAKVPLDAEGRGVKEMVLAQKCLALAADKLAAKEAATAARKRQKDLTADIARISNEIDTDSTMQMIPAIEEWDYDRFEVRTIRTDSSEVVNTRPMTVDERQVHLDLDLEGDPPKADEAPSGAKVVRIKGGGRKKPSTAPASH